MSDRLNNAIDSLRKEEKSLEQRVNALRTELKSTEADLKQVRGALSSLGQTRSEKKPAKSAVSQREVFGIIAKAIRKSSDLIRESDLKELLERTVVASGKSRSGLALRFNEVLKDDRFVRQDGFVRLSNGVRVSESADKAMGIPLDS